ncbi:MAG: hypothetical protein R2748_10980 [Bryobacterales bacterium]
MKFALTQRMGDSAPAFSPPADTIPASGSTRGKVGAGTPPPRGATGLFTPQFSTPRGVG